MKKAKSGSRHKKSSTEKYRKRRKKERGNRAIKQWKKTEAEFAQRLPGIHVPEVKEESKNKEEA